MPRCKWAQFRLRSGGFFMSDPIDPVAHLEAAMAMSRKINDKAERLLDPLVIEMRIMKWEPEFQAIMWEAVMLEAKRRMEEARP